MGKEEDVVITVKSEGTSEQPDWIIVSDDPDVVMTFGDYESIELTICDTEGE
jgi:hypothetical protein